MCGRLIKFHGGVVSVTVQKNMNLSSLSCSLTRLLSSLPVCLCVGTFTLRRAVTVDTIKYNPAGATAGLLNVACVIGGMAACIYILLKWTVFFR